MALVLNPQYAVTIRRPAPVRAVRTTTHRAVSPSTGVIRTAPRSNKKPVIAHTERAMVQFHGTAKVVQPSFDIYRRRRLIAVLFMVTFAAAVCLGVRALASRGDVSVSIPTVTPLGSSVVYTEVGHDVSGAYVQGPQYYVVQEGDTMWSIASSLTDGNIRSLVQELIALNGQASIDVGQRLTLPEI